MKKLQNNFTTPEQSKRLLELGIPANSADCQWYMAEIDRIKRTCYRPTEYYHPHVRNNHTYRFKDWFGCYSSSDIPCWSVGRLMEIFAICFDPDFIHFDTYADGINFLQQMMDKFETYAEDMDFSKLEE